METWEKFSVTEGASFHLHGGEPNGSRAGGHYVNSQKWAVCVTVTIEVNIKVTAVMPAFLTPPGSVPAPSRRRRWNVMKLNCSQPPFAASIRHCPGLLSSFQSLFLSADRQFC